jgi:hypothetical protein
VAKATGDDSWPLVRRTVKLLMTRSEKGQRCNTSEDKGEGANRARARCQRYIAVFTALDIAFRPRIYSCTPSATGP